MFLPNSFQNSLHYKSIVRSLTIHDVDFCVVINGVPSKGTLAQATKQRAHGKDEETIFSCLGKVILFIFTCLARDNKKNIDRTSDNARTNVLFNENY